MEWLTAANLAQDREHRKYNHYHLNQYKSLRKFQISLKRYLWWQEQLPARSHIKYKKIVLSLRVLMEQVTQQHPFFAALNQTLTHKCHNQSESYLPKVKFQQPAFIM